MQKNLPKGVFVKKGKKPGKTVAIFGGIHGNEKVGVKMLDILRKKLKVKAGTVYLVYGNPQAIKQNKRFIEKNLNRCFRKDNQGKTIEDERARELMDVLDKCDALLDLHSFTNPDGQSFSICEDNMFEIANRVDAPVVSFGWTDIIKGAAGSYMYSNNKMSLSLEAGSHLKIKESLKRARLAVDVFLKYFGCVAKTIVIDKKPKRYVRARETVIRKDKSIKFIKKYKNFDSLREGEIFAVEKDKKFIAKEKECIILPTPNEPIGGEICILGEIIENKK